jgi:hypothetical protein
MAKGQQRSNKEAKKPKATKPPAGAAPSPFAGKGSSAASPPPKKKG